MSRLRDLGLVRHILLSVAFIRISAILICLLHLLNSSSGSGIGVAVCLLVILNEVLLLRVSTEHLGLSHVVLLYVVGSLLSIH
jgi:hypothetical protein